MLRKAIASALMIACCSGLSLAQGTNPAGLWTTIDDKTGEKRADVQLVVENGVLHGTIVRRYLKPGDPERCVSCPEPFKDKPIQNLQFIWGMKELGKGTWGGGKLIDPKTGKIYRLQMAVKDDQLHVRGYIGVSLLGRTQVWVHAKR